MPGFGVAPDEPDDKDEKGEMSIPDLVKFVH